MRVLTTSLFFVALTASAFGQQKQVPVYFIAEYDVLLDAASLKKFAEAATPIAKAYGGQVVARRTKIVPGLGEAPRGVTIIMFENVEKAQAYFESAEYKAIIPLRDAAAKYRSYIVEAGDLLQ